MSIVHLCLRYMNDLGLSMQVDPIRKIRLREAVEPCKTRLFGYIRIAPCQYLPKGGSVSNSRAAPPGREDSEGVSSAKEQSQNQTDRTEYGYSEGLLGLK